MVQIQGKLADVILEHSLIHFHPGEVVNKYDKLFSQVYNASDLVTGSVV